MEAPLRRDSLHNRRVQRLPRAGRIALFCAGYVVASWVAGALTLPRPAFATFRPPNAFLIAVALLDRPERWWIYALATVPGNPTLYNPNTSWVATAGFALANVVEVALGIGLIRRVLGRTPRFAKLTDCAAFVIAVA